MPAPPPAPRSYLETPSEPVLALPPGACDTHVHVFGPADRFPYSPQRAYTPFEAPKETLFALHRRLGVSRCVIVQTAPYGADHAVIEDAIRAGGGRYLGVALVRVDVPEAELARLASVGFRGVRFNFLRHLGPPASVDEIVAFTARLAAHGMHLQVHFDSSMVHELAAPLARSAVPVVIDHMGRVDATRGPGDPDRVALMRMLEDPRFLVKVSGIDRVDRPPYAHGIALAKQLVDAFPDRCLWGTDWPHPNHDHIPDDGALVDALAGIAPDTELRRRVLVDNPQRLYRFAE